MQAYMETAFNIVYLSSILAIGIKMFRSTANDSQTKLFGIMAIVLGSGDAFHLIPRSYALFTTGLEANAAALGIGKLITSITMTIFYVVLFQFMKNRYGIKNDKTMSISIYLLAAVRIILCLFPQNEWLSYYPNVAWGIFRNIPFAIMGLIILITFYKEAKQNNDQYFNFMWLAIALSFGFYIPVVLWAKEISWVGALMIPKTIAYVWVVLMGYREFKDNQLEPSQA